MKVAILKELEKMRKRCFDQAQLLQEADERYDANYFAGKAWAIWEVMRLIKEHIENEIPWEV